MNIAVNLAGITISIALMNEAEKAISLCNQYVKGFVCEGFKENAKLAISILNMPKRGLPFLNNAKIPVVEQLVPTKDVAAWLREYKGYQEDFSITETTISSLCQGGLLLFDPDVKEGHMYLLQRGYKTFQPLYRLMWMYFAQVLGECGACFIHAAALAKDGEGYLFMGDSGAGKSTLASLCKDCEVLSDDGPILSKQNGECLVYPSPYSQIRGINGINNEAVHMAAPLKRMHFLIKAERVLLEEISKGVALLQIIKRFIHFFPYLSVDAKTTLFELFSDMCYKIPCYNFYFRLDQDISNVITRR